MEFHLTRFVSGQNKNKRGKMPQITLNKPAPDFQLADFNGNLIRLSEQTLRSNVLLVFNRGFV